MSVLRPTRTSRLLLALACCLGLLAPGGAALGAAAGAGPSAAPVMAGGSDGLGQALLRDRLLGPLVAPGAKRDDRERPGPALPGVLAAALATVGALTSRRLTNRPARRGAAAAPGARAPPPLQPAPI